MARLESFEKLAQESSRRRSRWRRNRSEFQGEEGTIGG